jgi:hypothetical protein
MTTKMTTRMTRIEIGYLLSNYMVDDPSFDLKTMATPLTDVAYVVSSKKGSQLPPGFEVITTTMAGHDAAVLFNKVWGGVLPGFPRG